jgi:uncharacterized protein (DUF1778 family)
MMKPRRISKTDMLHVRLEPGERETFERAARMSGLSLSAWIRLAARETAARQLAYIGEKPPWAK